MATTGAGWQWPASSDGITYIPGAIRLEDADGLRRTIITGTVVCEQPLLQYADAAQPMQTPAHRDYIRQRLPPHMAAHLDREISPAAARLRGDRPGISTE